MKVFEIILIAVGLSMDAFAVAVCLGLKMRRASVKGMVIIGLYFGLFQGLMPLIGYYIATLFADKIIAFDHWIAFALLLILGVKMIIGSMAKDEPRCTDRVCPRGSCADRKCPSVRCSDRDCPAEKCDDRKCPSAKCTDRTCPSGTCVDRRCPEDTVSLSPRNMLPFAIATSIDALAIGVSFAFLKVEVFSAIGIIGAITFCLSMVGVKIGNIFGSKVKTKAEIAGGLILILIGLKILIEHLFF